MLGSVAVIKLAVNKQNYVICCKETKERERERERANI
jgi:hypothetical protein